MSKVKPNESTQPVIDVENVSLAYKLYRKPSDTLKEAMFGSVHHDTFWAIRDISFQVSEGERLGIVGHNGAGKSTLLQTITGNLTPTSGAVSVRGRISSLLSMVPAWNAEENGIDNIKFNLLVQGVAEKRIPALIEEIVDFTELGPFILRPVKTYSTGMSARLSFAIATALDPEILIVDEILGSGDGYFAGKATQRMKEFCARGKALLFVSHATGAVQQMCNRAIWLHNGSIRLEGDVDYVLKQYELDFRRSEDEVTRAKHIAAAGKRLATVTKEEIPDDGYIRLRIVAKDSAHFHTTHYIRTIKVSGLNPEPVFVPLEIVDADRAVAALDVVRSEWGRIHERNGITTRSISHATGRRTGGHFEMLLPLKAEGNSPQIAIELESASDGKEDLVIEYLDLAEGCWHELGVERKKVVSGEWSRSFFSTKMNYMAPEKVEAVIAQISDGALPDAEILGAYIEIDGKETALVREREPFDICVRVLFRRAVEVADVGIKITRADGVYVFWQSSGQADVNLVRPDGEKLLRFRFGPNNIGSGEFFVNAHVSDGWLYPDNYPYSEVFAREINVAAFRVTPEFPEVDFGILNERVTVTVEGAGSEETIDLSAASAE
jgi:ABC-type polysaccharide/polyol phosphate transport system ATPase subunit